MNYARTLWVKCYYEYRLIITFYPQLRSKSDFYLLRRLPDNEGSFANEIIV